MNLKINNIHKYFTIWWTPLVTYFFIYGIFILGCVLQRDWVIDLFLYLFFINIFGTIISSIVQITIKKWYYIIFQIGITILLFSHVSIIFMFSPPDYYGVHKEIPNNIEIYEPVNKTPIESDFDNYDLILSGWGGSYGYCTDFKPTKKGEFYIKAFEITSNDRLSEKRIKESSKIKVDNIDYKIRSGHFTIYEGSWGYKYACRIELWFQPNNDKEFKVTERNYIVEGWMR
ncbi:hypothetical protein [Thalassobellus citreus]|uniref:hypothetical protein n=1 Tax=Thalassobellus citreus TaxID=3367752 RepID=UPI0037B603CE